MEVFNNVNQNVDAVKQAKKSKRKRIAKVVIGTAAAAAVVGGVIYAKSRGKKADAPISEIIKDVVKPFSEKDKTVKEKLALVANNVRELVAKKPEGGDVLDIKPKAIEQKAEKVKEAAEEKAREVLALPEKSSATKKQEIENYLKNLLFGKDKFRFFPQGKELPALVEGTEKGGAIVPVKAGEIIPVKKGEIAPVKKGEIIPAKKGELAETAKKGTLDIIDTAVKGGKKAKGGIGDGFKEAMGQIFGAAKDNAKVLRAGAVGVAAGAAAVKGAEEVSEAKEEKTKKQFGITIDGKEFDGTFDAGKAIDKNGNPVTGNMIVNYENGKKVIMKYKDGVLTQAVVFSSADKDVPESIKNYTGGKVSAIYEDLKATQKNGKKSYEADVTTALRDSSKEKRLIVKDGRITEEYYKKNLDSKGKVKGKPILLFSVRPETLEDGKVDRKTFSIPTKNGERTVRISEGRAASKTITLMSLAQKPLGVLLLDENRDVTGYNLFVNGTDKDGSIKIKDGKAVDFQNLDFFADRVVDKKSGLVEKVYFSSESDGRVKIYEKEGVIAKIECYSNNGDTPDCATEFTDGVPTRDVFYDENGNVVFSPKYSFKK